MKQKAKQTHIEHDANNPSTTGLKCRLVIRLLCPSKTCVGFVNTELNPCFGTVQSYKESRLLRPYLNIIIL